MDLEVISNLMMDLSYPNLCAQIQPSNQTQSYYPCMLDRKSTVHGFNLQWIRLCHIVITLMYPLGKVDPHGSFGIVS